MWPWPAAASPENGPNFDTRFLTQPNLCRKLHTFNENWQHSVISLELLFCMPQIPNL